MSGIQLFWKIVMIIGLIMLVDAVIGGTILASIFGPQVFLIAGLPQVAIGGILAFFGWKYSK